jgi:uncharacterized protein YqjF (DUF2071 family)
MRGTVVTRFLISYAVPPEALAGQVPPGAELSLHGGKAWISACFVFMNDMRPSFAPASLGMSYNYLIHRTRARLPFPDGKLRESVLVLEPNIDKRFLAFAGSRVTGISFKRRDIQLDREGDGWRLSMSHEGELLYDASISPSEKYSTLPEGSLFSNGEEADGFLLGVSHGGQWARETNSLCLLPETHDPWKTLVTSCETRKNAFIESLGCSTVSADHVITMTAIPHYFGIRPLRVRL